MIADLSAIAGSEVIDNVIALIWGPSLHLAKYD